VKADLPPADRAPLPERAVTVNQLVAYNLAFYRKAAGLTQEDLGTRLGGWSAASVSAAERSWDGSRVKKFDADEIANIAGALGVPVIALFLPPEDDRTAVHYAVHPPGLEATWPFDYGTAVLAAWDDADSPVMGAFRRRLIAAGETGQVDFAAPVRASEDLQRRIEDLRTFEREYRTKLQAYVEGQLLELYGPEMRLLAERRITEVLKRAAAGDASGVSALLLREDGTYGVLHYPPGSQDPAEEETDTDAGEEDAR
jgi:transcriptional regulator with XRE-family HTH domain